ncbi:monooxygenase [Microbacterium barkeri]|uniref:Monooxygenase n=1 Tax=Microbacterium barkeri TaxID=33917 RepID=A0A9W6H4B2_9MICO|nr:FAD-dependent oxidoreductase [Microbacterium barkeri]MDI6944267.1 FAD-dependent oxidoreductase [Microbacterium barkeri]MDR6875647.1 2-polyprenyl-6-methoxyphenol hydroxylase-like FAD-dependent oxidoreductase [Microbacterium barkeri]GLJ62280.1 monooxygenase [Microbacterium barkeri]
MTIDTDVIIIGGGPVGQTAAIDLHARGISSVIVERRRYLEPPNVKCNHVSSRTMERFRQLGLAEEVRNAGLPADYPQDVAFRTTLTGWEIGRIPIPARRDRYTSRTGPDTSWATPEPPHRINQTFLEPILQKHASSLPGVTVLWESEFRRYEQTEDGVLAVVTDLDGGNERVIRGRFLIGADGGRSLVRKQMGARLSGDAVLQSVQSTCIRAEGLYELAGGDRAWSYYIYNERRCGHIYAIDGREVFLVHNYLADGESSESVDRDRAIRTILGVGDDFSYEVVSKEDWVARRLVVDKLREGNVFLAGDAAHLWVPYAGYGMNAGIADVLNLTWSLAAVLDGWAGVRMLDAYQAERLPITDQVSRFAMGHQRKVALSRIPAHLEAHTEEGARERAALGQAAYELNVQQFAAEGLNYGYVYDRSPIISYDGEAAPSYSMGDYTPSTVPGTRAPHFWLADDVSLYDELGLGYTLLALGDTAAAEPLMAAARDANLPLKLIAVADGVAPDVYREAYVIVRHDQHIAWRGQIIPHDPNHLIDILRGAAPHLTTALGVVEEPTSVPA